MGQFLPPGPHVIGDRNSAMAAIRPDSVECDWAASLNGASPFFARLELARAKKSWSGLPPVEAGHLHKSSDANFSA